MSTAIARIYTPEGFVVAADGRAYDPDNRMVISDSVQKIFPIEQSRRRLAYALAGTAGLTRKNSPEVVFDFVSETAKAVEALAETRPRSLRHYATARSG